MSVEVSLNTPLADALSNVVQPKLTELGWSTGAPDDLELGEYIILMLVNGKTEDQIAAELSNDLLSFGPSDTGAADFAKWLFEQVHLLKAQTLGDAAPQIQQASQNQAIPSYQNGEDDSRQLGTSGTPDADMGEAMDDVQDGSMCVLRWREIYACLLTAMLADQQDQSPCEMDHGRAAKG